MHGNRGRRSTVDARRSGVIRRDVSGAAAGGSARPRAQSQLARDRGALRAQQRAMSADGSRWPVGILRRSGARAARRVLHVKYRSVPASPPPARVLPFDVDDTVSCFCRKARRKEREGEGGGDPKLYLQEALLERKLPELDMRQLVELPHGLDYNEWLASHTLALFEHVNLLYGTVSEFCTAASCGDMAGPGGRSYAWYDERGKKSRVAAPQYVDYVMTYTQKTINDETIFPTKYANEFPAQFEAVVRRVVRLLFHVVAHLYAAHFRELALLRLHAHLHLTFAHLTALDRRFALLDAKETEVLRDLEVALRLTEPASAGAAGSAWDTAVHTAQCALPWPGPVTAAEEAPSRTNFCNERRPSPSALYTDTWSTYNVYETREET
ncbi:MOB kinase activator-like 2 [Zerene cesonia]|uniref:MOB kinase activator-like 2 n=1 Tax=Zerene cesonia TaxID=33412 RepID=UPI0018E55C41|nr:MOB kinase activator-like 2 [Zerene cesonia]